jgi:hypothetical protein
MFSRIVYFLSVLLMCYTSFIFHPRWEYNAGEAEISWDVSGYYWYLPSTFIYKDLKHQSFKDTILQKYLPTNLDFQQGFRTDNGNYVMKYSSGMAIMYLPFFTAAHVLARPLGYPPDGFSAPYQFAIQLGGFLMAMLGLWYLRKLLLLYYDDKAVAITMLVLVWASNYLTYSTIDSGMSHNWLLTIYVFLLLNTHYFYQTFKLKYAIRIGLLVGMATLTRPTDLLGCLIPLLWGMERISLPAIKDRFQLIAKNYRSLLIAAACAAIVIAIQPIYWKYASGHWIVYSYQDQHLYFRSPNFMNYTFSYQSGWLVYSPIMIFAFIGIIPFLRNGKNKVSILSFFLLNYYIVCAWNIWWYGGRAMVQSYPVLLFPLASLIEAFLKRRLIWLMSPILLVCIYYNFWCIYQLHRGGLLTEGDMTKTYFWRVVGRWHVPKETLLIRDNAEQQEHIPDDAQLIYQNNFDTDTGIVYVTAEGGKKIELTKDHQVSDTYRLPLTGTPNKWVHAQATFSCRIKEWETWKMAQFIVQAVKGKEVVKSNIVRVQRLLNDGDTRNISVDMQIPENTDSLHVSFWNGSSDQLIWIDNLKIWTFSR